MSREPTSGASLRASRIWAAAFVAMVCTLSAARARAHDLDPKSESDNYARFWVTIDADRVAAQAMTGTTIPIGRLNLASNLVVVQNYPGAVDPLQGTAFSSAVGDGYRAPTVRLELGPAWSSGGLFLLPKVGLGFDFERGKVAPFVPQLIGIVQGGPIYIESWDQFFFYDMFDEGSQDSFYTRDALLVAASSALALGPQTEVTVAFKNSPGDAVRALPVGVRANWNPFLDFTIGLFLGYELTHSARNSDGDWFSGRLTVSMLW